MEIIQQISQVESKDLIKVVQAYIPENQKSKRGYLNLIVQNNLTYKDKKGQTHIGSQEDLISFLYFCSRTGLDPIAKQIHTQWRWDGKLGRMKMILVTAIDGFRLTAQRSNAYGGQDDTVFEVEDLFNPVTNESVKQLKATTTVYRLNTKTGERMPVSASARWNEYVQTYEYEKDGKKIKVISEMWKEKPYLMLGKCSESLALRKAFPQELSNVYTTDEIGADTDEVKQKLSELPIPEKFKKEVKVQAPQIDVPSKEVAEQVENKEVKDEIKNDEAPQQEKQEEPKEVQKDETQSNNKLNEILQKKKELSENSDQV